MNWNILIVHVLFLNIAINYLVIIVKILYIGLLFFQTLEKINYNKKCLFIFVLVIL